MSLAHTLVAAARAAHPALLTDDVASALAAALDAQLAVAAPAPDLVTLTLAIDHAIGALSDRIAWDQGGPIANALLAARLR